MFDAGRRRSIVAEQRAAYDASADAYRQTVLTAFQQVEDNLAALRVLENEWAKVQETMESAKEALNISDAQYSGRHGGLPQRDYGAGYAARRAKNVGAAGGAQIGGERRVDPGAGRRVEYVGAAVAGAGASQALMAVARTGLPAGRSFSVASLHGWS